MPPQLSILCLKRTSSHDPPNLGSFPSPHANECPSWAGCLPPESEPRKLSMPPALTKRPLGEPTHEPPDKHGAIMAEVGDPGSN